MEVSLGVLAVVLSILGTAVVNSVEIAVVTANRIRVHHLAEGGSRSAQAVERMQRDQERFFATSSSCRRSSSSSPARWAATPRIASRATSSGCFAATILTALVTAQFGDLIPKVLGAQAGERYALRRRRCPRKR